MIGKKENIVYDVYCHLCSNPSAVNLIKKYPKLISIYYLSLNPNPAIVDIVLQDTISTRDNIWETSFLQNKNSIKPFFQYLGIDMHKLLYPIDETYIHHSKDILRKKRFNWYYLCLNPHPCAIKILKLFPEKIHSNIVKNSGEEAYDLIYIYVKEHARNDPKILSIMCANTNPRVIQLLDEYSPDMYDWEALCNNPSAISILVRWENRYRIKALFLFRNPNIFVYNYENMRKNTEVFKEELMERVWAPSNIAKWMSNGYNEFIEYNGWM